VTQGNWRLWQQGVCYADFQNWAHTHCSEITAFGSNRNAFVLTMGITIPRSRKGVPCIDSLMLHLTPLAYVTTLAVITFAEKLFVEGVGAGEVYSKAGSGNPRVCSSPR
jgi:hypothetical protein